MKNLNFIPTVQQEILKRELRMLGKSENLEDHKIVSTDPDFLQVHIDLGDDTYIFSQADDGNKEGGEYDYSDFRAEVGCFSQYTEDDLEGFIGGYYDSLESLKKDCPESWKMIALECGFEQDLV